MNPTASTVGAYLRDLPPDRRVAMARLCSMIRRSARGVRESMRYGLAFYELDGPLFALESGRRHMSLYVAEGTPQGCTTGSAKSFQTKSLMSSRRSPRPSLRAALEQCRRRPSC
jgi:hypothetical protein